MAIFHDVVDDLSHQKKYITKSKLMKKIEPLPAKVKRYVKNTLIGLGNLIKVGVALEIVYNGFYRFLNDMSNVSKSFSKPKATSPKEFIGSDKQFV